MAKLGPDPAEHLRHPRRLPPARGRPAPRRPDRRRAGRVQGRRPLPADRRPHRRRAGPPQEPEGDGPSPWPCPTTSTPRSARRAGAARRPTGADRPASPRRGRPTARAVRGRSRTPSDLAGDPLYVRLQALRAAWAKEVEPVGLHDLPEQDAGGPGPRAARIAARAGRDQGGRPGHPRAVRRGPPRRDRRGTGRPAPAPSPAPSRIADGPAAGPGPTSPRRRPATYVPTEEWTWRLLDRGFTLDEAAAIRGLDRRRSSAMPPGWPGRGTVPIEAFLPPETLGRWDERRRPGETARLPRPRTVPGLWALFLACRGGRSLTEGIDRRWPTDPRRRPNPTPCTAWRSGAAIEAVENAIATPGPRHLGLQRALPGRRPGRRRPLRLALRRRDHHPPDRGRRLRATASRSAEFSDALRTLMRRNINSKSQKRLVRALNRQFTELAQLRRFATAVVATYLATDRPPGGLQRRPPPAALVSGATGTWSILTHEVGRVGQTGHEPPARDRRGLDLRPVRRPARPGRLRRLLHRRPDRGDGPLRRDARRGGPARDRPGAGPRPPRAARPGAPRGGPRPPGRRARPTTT